MPYVYVCPVCGDYSDAKDWCSHCNIPMKPSPHVDRFSHNEPDYGSLRYQQYIDSLLEQQAKEAGMLQVEVMGSDNHVFTVQIDSVIELPVRGTDIVCGKCGKKVKVTNVGAPYRPPSNGQRDTSQDEGQISGL